MCPLLHPGQIRTRLGLNLGQNRARFLPDLDQSSPRPELSMCHSLQWSVLVCSWTVLKDR